MMTNPYISLVVPVYNAEAYLNRCIDSVLSQDFVSWEMILVNDGSNDSSGMICDSYALKDNRISVIHKKNCGVSSARNSGVSIAKGEYLMFLDSDDALLPGALNVMAHAARANNSDFVLGGYQVSLDSVVERNVVPDADKFYDEKDMAAFFDENIRKNCEMLDAPWCKLFRMSIVADKHILFNQKLSYAEDKMFVFTFLTYAVNASAVAAPVYDYCLREGSLGFDRSSDRHIRQLLDMFAVYSPILASLRNRHPDSKKLAMLYHDDLVCRYIFRILQIFTLRPSQIMTTENLKLIYDYMSRDRYLSVTDVRIGQLLNVLLFKIGNVRLSYAFYCLTSKINSLFNA